MGFIRDLLRSPQQGTPLHPTASFSDFSLHTPNEVEEIEAQLGTAAEQPPSPPQPPKKHETPPSPGTPLTGAMPPGSPSGSMSTGASVLQAPPVTKDLLHPGINPNKGFKASHTYDVTGAGGKTEGLSVWEIIQEGQKETEERAKGKMAQKRTYDPSMDLSA